MFCCYGTEGNKRRIYIDWGDGHTILVYMVYEAQTSPSVFAEEVCGKQVLIFLEIYLYGETVPLLCTLTRMNRFGYIGQISPDCNFGEWFFFLRHNELLDIPVMTASIQSLASAAIHGFLQMKLALPSMLSGSNGKSNTFIAKRPLRYRAEPGRLS